MATINIIPQSPAGSVTINQTFDNEADNGVISTNLIITSQAPSIASVNVEVGVQGIPGPPGSGLRGPPGPTGIGIPGPAGPSGAIGPPGSGINSLAVNTINLNDVNSAINLVGSGGTQISENVNTNTIILSSPLVEGIYANVSHGHVASQISDFNESVDDRVADLLLEGNNIRLNYQDADFNSLTIAVTGLTIGQNVQAYNATLEDISNLTLESGKILYANEANNFELITLSNTSKNLLNDSSPEEQRNTLGLGTISTYGSGDYASTLRSNTFTGTQSFGDGQINRFSATTNNQTSASYEIVQSDNGKIITFDYDLSHITVSISPDLSVGFNCLLAQIGDGQVRISGSVQNRYDHTQLVGQYSIATLVKISDSPQILILSGDTTDANSGP